MRYLRHLTRRNIAFALIALLALFALDAFQFNFFIFGDPAAVWQTIREGRVSIEERDQLVKQLSEARDLDLASEELYKRAAAHYDEFCVTKADRMMGRRIASRYSLFEAYQRLCGTIQWSQSSLDFRFDRLERRTRYAERTMRRLRWFRGPKSDAADVMRYYEAIIPEIRYDQWVVDQLAPLVAEARGVENPVQATAEERIWLEADARTEAKTDSNTAGTLEQKQRELLNLKSELEQQRASLRELLDARRQWAELENAITHQRHR